MLRPLQIVVLIFVYGAFGVGNCHETNGPAGGSDVPGFMFEMLLLQIAQLEESIRQQIGDVHKAISDANAETKRTTAQLIAEVQQVKASLMADTQSTAENMVERFEQQLENTESNVRQLIQNCTGAWQTNLDELKAAVPGQCLDRDAFSQLLSEQSRRLSRKIDQTTVTSGLRQLVPSRHNTDVYIDSHNVHGFGGNWIVFQRRFDGSVNFTRNWSDYTIGFGKFDGEMWLGLENLYQLLRTKRHELLIVLEDFDGVIAYEHYDNFTLGNVHTNYNITSLGSYTGTAGSSFIPHEGCQFATYDKDFNRCASKNNAGWWYKTCEDSLLNGVYRGKNHKYMFGIIWYGFRGYYVPLKSSKMMVRPYHF